MYPGRARGYRDTNTRTATFARTDLKTGLLRRVEHGDALARATQTQPDAIVRPVIAKPDAIEAALAHREQNAVRRAYNRSQFLAERRALMAAWDNFLEGRPVVRADGTPVTEAAVIQFPVSEAKRDRASPRAGGL